ncbi:MAG TPA: XdhC family protein [Noviherbaspirillum sp.]|nr:XdhC family protein [Noviherbaspirillum sp.]
MDAENFSTLTTASAWRSAGHRIALVTAVATWGSSPRPVGAMMCIRDDGLVAGSVSGGCVEDDLIDRIRRDGIPSRIGTAVYGVTREEAARFGLPCGGTLRLVIEPVEDAGWIDEVLRRIARHELVVRTVNMDDGAHCIAIATGDEVCALEDGIFRMVFGPRWRILLIGAGQISALVAEIAKTLDFHVIVCDPREEFYRNWSVAQTDLLTSMPDDTVVALEPDPRTAIIALTHDPKLDDMALLEALKSPAFYVGALGSRMNTEKRRERLALFDLAPGEIDRLHGPVGLRIGSRTPAEIAISIMAEIVSIRSSMAVLTERTAACIA